MRHPPASVCVAIAYNGFGAPPSMLTAPVWDTVKRDPARIVSNLKLVVFPNPNCEDPGKALRETLGPIFFIVFLGLTLSWSASVKKDPWKQDFQWQQARTSNNTKMHHQGREGDSSAQRGGVFKSNGTDPEKNFDPSTSQINLFGSEQ